MSCAGCSVGTGSKAKGCRSNGSCSTGGCNRLNTYDWLNHMLEVDETGITRFLEVSFKNGARKEFFRNPNKLFLEKNDVVVTEVKNGGYDTGTVSLTGEMARFQMKKHRVREDNADLRNVIRKANEFDLKKWDEARQQEKTTMIRARAIARQMNLEMKVGDVEFQGDGRKATFYYISDDRVDFRELIKVYAQEFHVKIEMHQIGARQEAGRIGGIGSCGRELCCSTWLTEFKTVNTTAARYQNLSINQTKLSGQCGRLKCCLNYELDTYMDALQDFPKEADRLETENGTVDLMKTDIFKRLMWYKYRESTTFHPLRVERVKEILEMNRNGQKPADLGAIKTAPVKEVFEFADVVGQTSLKTLQNNQKRKKGKGKSQGSGQGNRNRPSGGSQTPRGAGARPPQQGGNPKPPQQGGGNKPAQGANPSRRRQGGSRPPGNRKPGNPDSNTPKP